MVKVLQNFIKYSLEELETYANTDGTCIKKINTNLRVSLGPYCLKNIKEALLTYFARKKIGFYDVHLNGIVLEIKNIKLLSNTASVRAEDPQIHIKLNADCYIFCPLIGAVLTGTVKHIGNHNVGVVLYRVFNANIRFKEKFIHDLEMEQEVQFCVRNFDLQNIFPYIDGNRLKLQNAKAEQAITPKKIKKFEDEDADEDEDEALENIPNKRIKFAEEDAELQIHKGVSLKLEIKSEEDE